MKFKVNAKNGAYLFGVLYQPIFDWDEKVGWQLTLGLGRWHWTTTHRKDKA